MAKKSQRYLVQVSFPNEKGAIWMSNQIEDILGTGNIRASRVEVSKMRKVS